MLQDLLTFRADRDNYYYGRTVATVGFFMLISGNEAGASLEKSLTGSTCT